MARRSQKAPTPAYASAIQAVLLNSWSTILAGHLSVYELSYRIEDAVNRVNSEAKPTGGRPRQYPAPELRARIRPLIQWPDGELAKRFKRKGVWPDTKSKWRADTADYLQGWWQRRGEDTLLVNNPSVQALPYPAEELGIRLGPNARKGTNSLLALAWFLVSTRYRLSPETLRDCLKPPSKPKKI
jgi:hypothetical protein